MNPKTNKRKPPSLLLEEDDAGAISPRNVIPNQQNNVKKSFLQKRRLYFFPILCGLVFGIGGLIIYALPQTYRPSQTIAVTPPSDGVTANGQNTTYALPDSPSLTSKRPVPVEHPAPVIRSAIIVNEQPPVAAKPALELNSSPAKTVAKLTLPPPTIRPKPLQQITPVSTKAPPSSDVDVLIALMRYSHDGKTSELIDLQEQLDQCPAPNTKAGIQCRQTLCANQNGDSPLCPKSK